MSILNAPKAVVGGVLDPIAAKIQNPFGAGGSAGVRQGLLKPDFTEGFRIVEIVNGKERKSDEIVLLGNMLPMVPFTFGGSQRITKDYYPGNSEPSVQVLGPKESDVTIKGRLKDKRYKATGLYGVSTEIQQQIDAMRIRGNLLKITLGEWKRFGFLEETEFELAKLSDCAYQLKFSIIGFNPPKNCKFTPTSKEIPFAINKDLIAQATAFQAKYSSIPESMPKSLADIINDALNDVAEAINLVTDFVDTVVTTAEDTVAASKRVLGLVKNARAGMSRFKRRLGSLSYATASLSTEARAARRFSAAAANQAHISGSLSGANELTLLLARLQAQFEAISKTLPLTRHQVKDGDTLQKISVKYYGTSDNWKKIYDHNRLSSTQLSTPRRLEIPKV